MPAAPRGQSPRSRSRESCRREAFHVSQPSKTKTPKSDQRPSGLFDCRSINRGIDQTPSACTAGATAPGANAAEAAGTTRSTSTASRLASSPQVRPRSFSRPARPLLEKNTPWFWSVWRGHVLRGLPRLARSVRTLSAKGTFSPVHAAARQSRLYRTARYRSRQLSDTAGGLRVRRGFGHGAAAAGSACFSRVPQLQTAVISCVWAAAEPRGSFS